MGAILFVLLLLVFFGSIPLLLYLSVQEDKKRVGKERSY